MTNDALLVSVRGSSSSAGSDTLLLPTRSNYSESFDSLQSGNTVNQLDGSNWESSQAQSPYSVPVCGRSRQPPVGQSLAGNQYENLGSKIHQYCNTVPENSGPNSFGDGEHGNPDLTDQLPVSKAPQRLMLLQREDSDGARSVDEFQYLEPGENIYSASAH